MSDTKTDARALAEQYVKRWFCQDNEILWERGGHYKEEIEALLVLLAQAQRETFMKVARHVVDNEDDFTQFVDVGTDIPCVEFDAMKFASWCRQQAQEVGDE